MKSIGIDIGTFSIKIAHAELDKDKAIITKYDELKLSQDPTKDRTIDIIDQLKTYFKKFEDHGAFYVFALNQSSVIHRQLFFPFKERHNILKTIAFELEDEIPFSYENAIFDAKITHYQENAAHVIGTIAPKYQIEKLIQNSKDYGVPTHIVSVESLALANLFENWTDIPKTITTPQEELPEAKKAIAYLHVGHHKSLFLVYSDNILIDVEHITWGTENIAQKISEKYNIPFSESLKELKNKGFILIDPSGTTEDQKTFSEVIQFSLIDLIKILKLSLLDISSKNNIQIDQLNILGALSQIKNIGPYLTQNFNMATNPFSLPNTHLQIKTNKLNPVTGVVAIGLAIEGLKKPRNPATNLLKGEFAVESNQLALFWKSWSPTIIRVFAIFVLMVIYGVLRTQFSQKMADESLTVMQKQAESVAGLKKRNAKIRNINKYIKNQERKKKQQKLFEELQGVNSALDILKQISQVSPQKDKLNFEIKKLSIKGELVKMEGVTHKNSALNLISTPLKNISMNKKVKSETPTLKSKKQDEKSFAYSFKVPRK